jgi:hypothetical protein
MNLPDLINGAFEFFGCAAIAPSVIRALRLKKVQGVHWATPVLLELGCLERFLLPEPGPVVQFSAGLLVLFANTAWLYCVLKYTKHEVV